MDVPTLIGKLARGWPKSRDSMLLFVDAEKPHEVVGSDQPQNFEITK